MNAEILTNEAEGRTSNTQERGRTSNVQLSTFNAEQENGEVTTASPESEVSTYNAEPAGSEGTSNTQERGRTSNFQLSTFKAEQENGQATEPERTVKGELSTCDLEGADRERTSNTQDQERTVDLQRATSNFERNGEDRVSQANLEPTNGVEVARSNSLSDFTPTEPWPEAVSGAELLDALTAELRRFVVLGDWMAETFALWVLHTHAYRLRQVTTYMGIESPEKECGKSTLLTALSRLVERPAISANISPSAFFHAIEQLRPTLLIDEADTNLRGKDDITGILNAGYTKSTAFVWRMSYDAATGAPGKRAKSKGIAPGRVARYSCWCPKAIAGIGRLPATLASRCIVVQMHRKRSANNVNG